MAPNADRPRAWHPGTGRYEVADLVGPKHSDETARLAREAGCRVAGASRLLADGLTVETIPVRDALWGSAALLVAARPFLRGVGALAPRAELLEGPR